MAIRTIVLSKSSSFPIICKTHGKWGGLTARQRERVCITNRNKDEYVVGMSVEWDKPTYDKQGFPNPAKGTVTIKISSNYRHAKEFYRFGASEIVEALRGAGLSLNCVSAHLKRTYRFRGNRKCCGRG